MEKISLESLARRLYISLEILKKKIMWPMAERFFYNNDNSNTLTY